MEQKTIENTIELRVVNSPNILVRVIQIVKRRRINIRSFFAEEDEANPEDAIVKLVLSADEEQARLLKTQFLKQIDVMEVK